jgi:hypothetical protein
VRQAKQPKQKKAVPSTATVSGEEMAERNLMIGFADELAEARQRARVMVLACEGLSDRDLKNALVSFAWEHHDHLKQLADHFEQLRTKVAS